MGSGMLDIAFDSAAVPLCSANARPQQQKTPLARVTLLTFYGIGAIPPAVKSHLVNSNIFYFYNQVLQLQAVYVSAAMCIALVLDAIFDPLVGYLSDSTHSRLGRRHPYIYASLMPSAACYCLLLSLRPATTQQGLFLQLTLLLCLLRLSWACYEVPRGALAPAITKDYEQRTQLAGFSLFFSALGGLGVSVLSKTFFLKDSFDNPDAYASLGRWGGGALLVFGTIFAVGTHGQDLEEEPKSAPTGRAKAPQSVCAEVVETLSHPPFLTLLGAGLLYSMYIGVTYGLSTYFLVHLWQWTPQDTVEFDVVNLVATLIVCVRAASLTSKWDKKQLALLLFSVSIALSPLLYCLRLADVWLGIPLLPRNGAKYGPLWWVMLVHNVVWLVPGELGFILLDSMNSDIVEDGQLKTGRRSAGLFLSGPALLQKSVSGLGTVAKGALISATGFSQADDEAQKVTAVHKLAFAVILLTATLPVGAVVVLAKYGITRAQHEETLSQLGYKAQQI